MSSNGINFIIFLNWLTCLFICLFTYVGQSCESFWRKPVSSGAVEVKNGSQRYLGCSPCESGVWYKQVTLLAICHMRINQTQSPCIGHGLLAWGQWEQKSNVTWGEQDSQQFSRSPAWWSLYNIKHVRSSSTALVHPWCHAKQPWLRKRTVEAQRDDEGKCEWRSWV